MRVDRLAGNSAHMAKGVAIEVPAVDFSGYTGDFRFEIRIRDARDRPGEAQFRVTIRS